jgi:hypothetical protein
MNLFKRLFFSDSRLKSDVDRSLNRPYIHPVKINCKCKIPPLSYKNYIDCWIGVDKRNGRFADVEIKMCLHCKRKWVKYLVEFEAFSESGRWYSGIVDDSDLQYLTPENAIECIERLD